MENKHFKCIMVFVFLFFNLMLTGAIADVNNEKGSHLTVPWDEFKNFLPLENDEIILPMEIFQKLLEQTGAKTKPEHTVKDLGKSFFPRP